ncbi:MAG: aminoglycoside phosphotransferase family protein [Clostridiales bacterium]|nr:aminoglycoside phosphotransferase family protein [Clostridiales bacterium]
MFYVIIPSAVLVPEELQNMGKLPPIIYPVNQNIVFDFLYKQYSDLAKYMTVICFEQAAKIHRRLGKYEGNKVRLLDLKILKDLGHTIYESIDDNLKSPIVINFADTIVMDDIFTVEGDAFYYQEDYLNDKWTYFEENDGEITKIIDKQILSSDETKKLFVGVFQLYYPQDFKNCLETAFQTDGLHMSTFYYALQLYSRKHPLKAIRTENWFDLGHIDKYYNSSLEVKAREFNHIMIDKERGILRKTSTDKDKFIGEILWYLKLPKDVEYIRPRIFNYSTSYNTPYVAMEYYSYHTVHELFLYGDLNYSQWRNVFKRIKFICDDLSRYTVKDENIKSSLEDMYLTKTIQRLDKLRSDKDFEEFFRKPFSLNGVVYESLDDIVEVLKLSIPQMLYDVESFCIIHGDLCFANIMVDSNFNFIKVIDPRGKFGSYDIYGDERYELAKLFHSIHGKYDFIIKDLFNVDVNLGSLEIQYQVNDRVRDYDLYEILLSVFRENIDGEKEKIELIEALLFLSMIPLHGESKRHQYAMLATGIQILDNILRIRRE